MQRKQTMARIGLFLSLLTLLPLLLPLLGVGGSAWVERLRALMVYAGGWGWLAFLMLFVGMMVLQVPAFALVIAAPTLFRPLEAWSLCVLGSNLGVLANFSVVRAFGGQPLGESDSPLLRRLFTQLSAHPVRTVTLLRMLTIMFPPVTSALALTQVRARDHALGSFLGMLLPLTGLLFAAGALSQLSR